MPTDARLQREIDTAIKRLNQVSDRAVVKSRKAFRKAAPIMIKAIKARAPKGGDVHRRYRNGEVVATYYPGNLRRSFRSLTFRRSAAIFIGPKLDKSGSGGVFRGRKSDAYYAHWVEYGRAGMAATPFVRPAAEANGGQLLAVALDELTREVKNEIARR